MKISMGFLEEKFSKSTIKPRIIEDDFGHLHVDLNKQYILFGRKTGNEYNEFNIGYDYIQSVSVKLGISWFVLSDLIGGVPLYTVGTQVPKINIISKIPFLMDLFLIRIRKVPINMILSLWLDIIFSLIGLRIFAQVN